MPIRAKNQSMSEKLEDSPLYNPLRSRVWAGPNVLGYMVNPNPAHYNSMKEKMKELRIHHSS